MQLSIVVTVLGQHEMATLAIRNLVENCEDPLTNIVVVDNGGDYVFPDESPRVVVERRLDQDLKPVNMGVYPVFQYAMDVLPSVTGDVVAFFHSDLMVVEKGFDVSILKVFRECGDLGLMGFVGSNEIDYNGGRGGGTTSNFQGGAYMWHRDQGKPKPEGIIMEGQAWTGSPAESHGKRNAGFTPAAVVDGCAMIITRKAWKRIGFRADFPPHHFYDRLISTQMLEAGFKVGVLGVACDHLGGQTVSRETRYGEMGHEWLKAHDPKFIGGANIDQMIYEKAESMWLREYRDRKHLVPICV